MPTRRDPVTRDELIAFAFEEIRNLKRRLAALSGSARSGDHGGLTGLGDDDHPQYETAAEVAAQVAAHAALPDVHHLELITEDEGVELGRTSRINVVGTGIAATWVAGEMTITHTASAGSAHVIQEDGTPLADRANLNFRNGLLASDGGAGPDSTIVDLAQEVREEGVDQGDVHTWDFVGSGVTVTVAAGVATVTVSAAGHTIKEDGTPLATRAGLNFATGLVATDDAGNNETDVDIDDAYLIGIGFLTAGG